MDIITRKQAKANKQRFYFTNKPCRYGHVSKRRTATGVCCICETIEQQKNGKVRNERFLQKHGVQYRRNYLKSHYRKNKSRYLKRTRDWQLKNPEKVKSYVNKEYMKNYLKKWWVENKDKQKEYSKREYTKLSRKKWNRTHKGKKLFYTRNRQWVIKRATPKWANLLAIKMIYEQAAQRTKHTNLPHEVDHIIPLQGKLVCGLHVDYNLQILTKEEHKTKLNKF